MIQDLTAAFALADESDVPFKDAANKLSNRKDLCAMLLLDKLLPGEGYIIRAAEHDVIYFEVKLDALAAVASQDDILLLCQCGADFDDYNEALILRV